MTASIRKVVEAEGDRLTDIHVWRLGPGHLGVIVSVATASDRGATYYHSRLARFANVSHLTVEVLPLA
jgi:Co/Zn/Cd efflux system component